jgi:CRISPR-associated endonuclease Cas3-HD
LDVAACGESLLKLYRERLVRLAEVCNVDADDLASLCITLIALHDIGKCARGFQGKVLDLWPECLGPKPEKELSVRHDAAGVWLFHYNDKLIEITTRLLPELTRSQRLVVIQSVCGHHGQPIEKEGKNYPDIRNQGNDIGLKSQEAAATIAAAIIVLCKPNSCRLTEESVPLISFWLAGLAVLSGARCPSSGFGSLDEESLLVRPREPIGTNTSMPMFMTRITSTGMTGRSASRMCTGIAMSL